MRSVRAHVDSLSCETRLKCSGVWLVASSSGAGTASTLLVVGIKEWEEVMLYNKNREREIDRERQRERDREREGDREGSNH